MSAYRSAYQHIVGTRLAEVRLAREMVEPLLPQLRSIRSARIARAFAGGIGIVGAIVMVAFALIDDDAGATYALIGAVAGSAAAYVLARTLLAIADGRGDRPLALPRLTGQLSEDIAAIDAIHPFQGIARCLGQLEVWSTALPLAAISLLAPLSLHWAFVTATGAETDRSFATWIRVSLVIVGHAHITLMALAISFARRMKEQTREGLAGMAVHREWGRILAITVGVAALPGILFFLVPPVLTAITGLAFIPLMLILMRRRVMNERAMMDLVEEASNLRIAVDAPRGVSAIDEQEAWAEIATENELANERPVAAARV